MAKEVELWEYKLEWDRECKTEFRGRGAEVIEMQAGMDWGYIKDGSIPPSPVEKGMKARLQAKRSLLGTAGCMAQAVRSRLCGKSMVRWSSQSNIAGKPRLNPSST